MKEKEEGGSKIRDELEGILKSEKGVLENIINNTLKPELSERTGTFWFVKEFENDQIRVPKLLELDEGDKERYIKHKLHIIRD